MYSSGRKTQRRASRQDEHRIPSSGRLLFGLLAPALAVVVASLPARTLHGQQPGSVKWTAEIGDDVYGTPALGDNGLVYAGSDDDRLYAFDQATGAKVWDHWAGRNVGTPVVGPDGTVYAISANAVLWACDGDTGAVRWRVEGPGRTPALDTDGRLHTADWSGTLASAFDARTGTKLWQTSVIMGMSTAAVLGNDGMCYYGASGGRLYALDAATGEVLWWTGLPGNVQSNPAIGRDGRVYIGCGNSLCAVDGASGEILWESSVGGATGASPAIASDGTVYLGSADWRVYAFDGVTGETQWEHLSSTVFASAPALAADGSLYFVQQGGFYVLDARTGVFRWRTGNQAMKSSPAIGPDGTVYVGTSRALVAYYGTGAKLADSPWPKIHRNVRNTGEGLGIQVVAAPLGVLASQGAHEQRIRVTWEATPDAPWYRVYRGESPAGTRMAITGWQSERQFDDHDVEPQRRYSYWVRAAVDADGAQGGRYSAAAVGWRAGEVLRGTILWQYDAAQEIESSPALGPDGRMYVGCSDGGLLALAKDTGEELWRFATGGRIASSPALTDDGLVCVGSDDKKVYCVDARTGGQVWEFLTGGKVESSPAVSAAGIAYVGSADGWVYALGSQTGKQLWKFPTGGVVASSPALGMDGTVFIGSGSGKVYALDAQSGQKLWDHPIPSGMYLSSPAIGADGTLFAGSAAGSMVALAGGTGEELWAVGPLSASGVQPVVGPNNRLFGVFSGGIGSNLVAFDAATGEGLWSYSLGSYPAHGAATLGADGLVYVGKRPREFLALDSATGDEVWSLDLGGWVNSSAAISEEGILYVGSRAEIGGHTACGRLHAIYCGSPGLADGPWPKFRQNNRNDGGAARLVGPVPPSKVRASRGDLPDRVRISWEPGSEANYFQVYRSVADEDERSIVRAWETDTAFDDVTAEAGVIYVYWIRAASEAEGSHAGRFVASNPGWWGATSDAFDAWLVQQGIPQHERGALNCPVGDGVPNLVKYALGLPGMEPTKAEDLFAWHYDVGEGLALVFRKSKSAVDALIYPEWSSDLRVWGSENVVMTKLGEDETHEEWKASVQRAGSCFLRLRAELIP